MDQINFKLSKLAVDKFDIEMLKKRQEGFQRFMSRLMNHPRIVTVGIVHHFVRTEDWKAKLMVRKGGKMVPWSSVGVNDAMVIVGLTVHSHRGHHADVQLDCRPTRLTSLR